MTSLVRFAIEQLLEFPDKHELGPKRKGEGVSISSTLKSRKRDYNRNSNGCGIWTEMAGKDWDEDT